ncbi:MAG TPA: VOC family protein [Candidatus Elarobacter sp.]|jgi:catechol 2,3-dioxygenase-like lactoylglutathione lyase family enzyme|nr:VOC family protein [Candidatus Elarobacter sp.]
MASSKPVFNQVNVVVRDMAETLAFYRRLGLAVDEDRDPDAGDGAEHVDLAFPGGVSLEFDNLASARIWHAGWRENGDGCRAILGFALPSRDAVDERYAELTAAGYTGRQPPHDAFWGARYAIVADPNGIDVGLMSPIDRQRKFTPPEFTRG